MEIVNLKKTVETRVIKKTVEALKSGGLVVYPTETLYGIGADATNQKAVDKLLQYKARRGGKPLSIACGDKIMASKYVFLNETALNIYKNFLPGPVTVVSRSKHKVSKGVESELGTLGIRILAYPLIRAIIQAFGKPITATSANASYQKRPYSIKDIFDNISTKQKKLIDLVLDAGQLPKREPSTVVDTTLHDLSVLRQGDVKLTKQKHKITKSPKETIALGALLMNQYKHYLGFKSVIFALQGELGAGKTQFTKGIAKSLGVKEQIVSPTFILERDYKFYHGKKCYHLCHIDTWRMLSGQEFLNLEFDKMIDAGAVIAIEWAEKVSDILQKYSDEAKILWVKIQHGRNNQERIFSWSDSILQSAKPFSMNS